MMGKQHFKLAFSQPYLSNLRFDIFYGMKKYSISLFHLSWGLVSICTFQHQYSGYSLIKKGNIRIFSSEDASQCRITFSPGSDPGPDSDSGQGWSLKPPVPAWAICLHMGIHSLQRIRTLAWRGSALKYYNKHPWARDQREGISPQVCVIRHKNIFIISPLIMSLSSQDFSIIVTCPIMISDQVGTTL